MIAALTRELADAPDKAEYINQAVAALHAASPYTGHPVGAVQWVHIDQVQANDYNPNAVAQAEMRLLYVSISHDGYTQPVVTIYNPDLDKYVIVDGFHRYSTMRQNRDIYDSTGGMLPIVVIDKDDNERMASTIRHNRARGKHSIAGMGRIVFDMLTNGASDAEICHEVGLEPEELARLKHITGFSKLFANTHHNPAWETDTQIAIKKKWRDTHNEQPNP